MSTGDSTVQWVWPQLEDEVPPPVGGFDGGFGPVYLNDQIVLLFSPSSYTGDLTWYCDWSDTEQGAFWTIANPTGSPLTYTFNETTPNPTDIDDVHTCHFYNLDGSIGNSQTFQYFNFPSNARTLWQQSGSSGIPSDDGSSSSSTSSSSSISPSTSTSTSKTGSRSTSTSTTSSSATGTGKSPGATKQPSTPSGTSSVPGAGSSSDTSSSPGASSSPSAPNSDASSPQGGGSSSSSHSLSTGAAVGITIAAIVAALAIAALVFFLRRRMRRSRQDAERSTVGTEVTGPNGAQATGEPSMQQIEGWNG